MRKEVLTSRDIKHILAFEHWMTLDGEPAGRGPWGTTSDEASMVVDEENPGYNQGLFSSAEPGSFMLKLRNNEDLDDLIETIEGYIDWLEGYSGGFEEEFLVYTSQNGRISGEESSGMFSPSGGGSLTDMRRALDIYQIHLGHLRDVLKKLRRERYRLLNEALD